MKQMPLDNPFITQIYKIKNKNYISGYHTGIDMISLSKDTKVKAIANGKVINIGYEENGYGNYVCIQNNDGIRTYYCHLKSTNVVKEKFIKVGDIVGIEGTTGKSTGVHLHLETRKSPYNYGKDDTNVAKYLGIENKNGKVEEIESMNENEAFEYLVEKGRILDKTYWKSALEIVKNFNFILIKWAEDVKKIEE